MKVIGQSHAILEVQEKIDKIAAGITPVLLVGESGTGKEFFARMIHERSPRSAGPFVAVNLAAIPKDLHESELFGYEIGVLAGGPKRKIGKLEAAARGTVYLDKVASISLTAQTKLLHFLEYESFVRVEGRRQVAANVRIVAATDTDLKESVTDRTLLENLYYRLNVLSIVVPPIRERKEDILLFVEHFLERYSLELKKEGVKVSPSAQDVMMRYPWPGNVDEIESCIERAVVMCDGRTIEPVNLGIRVPVTAPVTLPNLTMEIALQAGSLREGTREAVRAVETQMIARALRETGWNKSKAAEKLNISYKTLLTKIKECGLEK